MEQSHRRKNQISAGVLVMNSRLGLASILAAAPLFLFLLLAFSGIGSFGYSGVLLGLILGLPFWLLLVLPVYFLSGCGRRWSLTLTVLICFLAVMSLYLYSFWTPTSYTLIVGGKVLVQAGVASSAYYEDLWAHVLAAGIAVALGYPIFSWGARPSKAPN